MNPELADSRLTAPIPVQSTAPPPAADAPADRKRRIDAASAASRSDTRLNPKYTFDNFVIGQSNRFAHAAAVAVAEAPAKAYNPLFIYGDSGPRQDPPPARHRRLRDEPVPRHPRALRLEPRSSRTTSSTRSRTTAARLFQARYRDVDILLIDDIQFLQGRAETQEAFFHTFNTLHDHDKQVVITSDVPPKHLTGFEDRMRSRFEWGLITDVQAPDLETRIAILRKKAQSERLQIPDEVLEYIATKVSSNIRELEGALIRVSAFASLNRSHARHVARADGAAGHHRPGRRQRHLAGRHHHGDRATYFKLTVDDLYGSSRSQAVATARQIAMYLCRERTSLSLPKIGQLFGNRDHTTVMYAYKKISELMKERRSIYNQVSEITAQHRAATHR